MNIGKLIPRGARRLLMAVGIPIVTAGALLIPAAQPAAASAQTCITYQGGFVCTQVNGQSNWVAGIEADWVRVTPPWGICNYSAWFFYIPPTGGAYGLSYQSRAGCGFGQVWLDYWPYRYFPHGTLVCAKFYENWGQIYDGQRCVGLS